VEDGENEGLGPIPTRKTRDDGDLQRLSFNGSKR